MDILHLVDRLEELFNESKPFLGTRKLLMDEDKLLDLIDQMRLAIPEEVKVAQQTNSQKDRILAQASEEAARTINAAREKGIQLVERDNIVQSAKLRAEQIESQAKENAAQILKDADKYAMETLVNLQIKLERNLAEVKRGIQILEQEQKQKNASNDDMPNP
jgi:cell division septum initiation protein DivIVA